MMSKRKKTATPPSSPPATDRAPHATGRTLAVLERAGDESEVVLPERVPILPLRTDVVFPQTVVPLIVNRPVGIRLIDDVLIGDRTVGLATQNDPESEAPRARICTRPCASARC